MIDSEDFRQWAGPARPPSPSEMSDRFALMQLVKIYALGVDMRDTSVAMSVFAPDAFVEGTLGDFPSADYIPRACAGAAAYTATQHNIHNQYVTVEGDEAVVWSYAVAYHMEAPGSDHEDLIMGVQYRDRCRRFAQGWQIVHRKVAGQWMRGPLPSGA